MTQPPPSSDRAPAWIVLGLAAVFALMGGIFIAVGRHMNHRWEASLTWPSTDAVVLSSSRSSYTDPGQSIPRPTGGTEYRYTVNGHAYEFRSSGYLGQREPRATNERVRVYYDPTNPSTHMFDEMRGHRDPMFEIIGALCVLVTLPFWYLALRMFMRARAKG